MTVYYLDADGVLKMLLDPNVPDERQRAQLGREAKAMNRFMRKLADDDLLYSSLLMKVEIVRTLKREGVAPEEAGKLLRKVDLLAPEPGDWHAAAELDARFLRTLDALHLAVARRIGADVLVTYDAQLIAAAEQIGMRTLSPGRRPPRGPTT